MNGGASRIPLVLTALAVLALVALVAVAAKGSTPTGTDEARQPADIFFDTLFTLSLLALVPAFLLAVYGLMQRKEIAREVASGKYRRSGILSFLGFWLLVAAVFYWRARDWQFNPRPAEGEQIFPGETTTPAPPPGTDVPGQYEPQLAWIPVLVVLTLAAIGVAAYVIAVRRRSADSPFEEELAGQLADALDDSLDDLRAEADARRAVIAAYARLEQSLAAGGLPRSQHETPEEYVHRVLARLEVDGRPIRTLTDLYTWAKFSQHAVDDGMKTQAIEALEEIRDELRESARRREEEREQSLTVDEQAATS